MVTISFFETKNSEKQFFKKKLGSKKYSLKFSEKPLSIENVSDAKGSDMVVVFITSKVTKEVIQKLPKLKKIITMSTGFDHIDVKECKKKKISAYNVPFYGENTVAEHTMALVLSLSRNVHKSYLRTLRNDFSIDGLEGFDLKGKTLGLVGGGHIGMHVARMAKAFDMKVRVFDTNRQNFLADVIGFKYVDFEELLKTCDIISLHVPYNEHTHHLINMKNIKLIKKGAILINTARGGVVETDALLYALENKILGGAGLDVIEGEELVKDEKMLHHHGNSENWKTIIEDHKIFNMDNVVFTPHNAFNSKESLLRILETTVENIIDDGNSKSKNKLC